MSDLDTFDDRTIKRAREKFTNGKRGSGDDPIATHSKVAQDVMLGNLRQLIARAQDGQEYANTGLGSGPAAGNQGELDTDSLIDPFLSYDENVAEIRERYGVNFRTYAERERAGEVKDADQRARKHARETLRENAEAIEAGERAELVQDIVDEYGRDFVADVLGRERSREPEAGEPVIPSEPEPVPEPEPGTPGEVERPSASAADETPSEPAATQATLASTAASPTGSPTSGPTVAAAEPADPSGGFSGILAAFALLLGNLADSAQSSAATVALAFEAVLRDAAGEVDA